MSMTARLAWFGNVDQSFDDVRLFVKTTWHGIAIDDYGVWFLP
jgi:hypothetical protein